jgi:PmbA protein
MDQLMKLAKAHSDGVELYQLDESQSTIEFEAAKLKDIQSTMQSGITMRIIKDGKAGFAYTRNLRSNEKLVRNALDTLKGGVDAPFDFPETKSVSVLDTYNPDIEHLTNSTVVDECRRIYDFMEGKTKGQVNIDAGTAVTDIQIVNSSGTSLSTKSSYYGITVIILYPGSATGIYRSLEFKNFTKVDDSFLNSLIDFYNKGGKELNTAGGRMKVLFMPEAMYTLIWRLQSAVSAESLHHKQSPLAGKLNTDIFSKQLSIVDNPLDDTYPGARAFDDEGVACKELAIVDKGLLRNYYYDLYYAAKMHAEPNGRGFKTSRWSGDRISTKPAPALTHLLIKPGATAFEKLVRTMDRGIIVCGALGAHSGNIPNGDFSIGLSPGLYVENGEIVGRIKDAMIAGNIYSVMNRVIDIEDKVRPAYTGNYPAVLFDDINVATKT